MAVKMIAEICQNHNGDSGLINDLVCAAKESGASYAKMQTIHSNQLTHRKRFDNGIFEGSKTRCIRRPYKAELERLSYLDLTDKCVEVFLNACEKYKIEPMTTIFTRDIIKKTFKQGFKNIKLASFDCISNIMAEEIMEYDPSLLIVSTGCTYKREIESMVKVLKNAKRYSLLHCISIYPTPLFEANLSRLEYLKSLVKSVGLSDHSNFENNGLTILKWSVCKGIDFVERHFTILDKKDTKDGVVSLNPDQMREAVEICNWDENDKSNFEDRNKDSELTIMGNPNRELSDIELLNRDYYQGRFASKSKDNELIFNWDRNFKFDEIKHSV
ncbi:N-acetylneuraminate synthase family protein [Prochlorococcus sp. AH-716-F13]|nr:N-acetylneuraminate synthase family protein [Prochlorococcus sp. AH-716-F13]